MEIHDTKGLQTILSFLILFVYMIWLFFIKQTQFQNKLNTKLQDQIDSLSETNKELLGTVENIKNVNKAQWFLMNKTHDIVFEEEDLEKG